MKQRLHRLDVVTINHQKIVWLTIWSIVCRGFPHMHDGSETWCHRTRLAAHRPWPVRNLFNVDHRRRCRLKPGGQMIGSVASDWLTTVVLNHASIHSDAAVASGAGLSNQIGCLDRRRTEGWELISEHSDNLSFNWIVWNTYVRRYDWRIMTKFGTNRVPMDVWGRARHAPKRKWWAASAPNCLDGNIRPEGRT